MERQEHAPPDKSQHLPRPFWIPGDADYERLPDNLRLAMEEIVIPFYQEVVVEAETSLEKGYGSIAAHQLWLMILEQVELGKKMSHLGSVQRIRQTASHRPAQGVV